MGEGSEALHTRGSHGQSVGLARISETLDLASSSRLRLLPVDGQRCQPDRERRRSRMAKRGLCFLADLSPPHPPPCLPPPTPHSRHLPPCLPFSSRPHSIVIPTLFRYELDATSQCIVHARLRSSPKHIYDRHHPYWQRAQAPSSHPVSPHACSRKTDDKSLAFIIM